MAKIEDGLVQAKSEKDQNGKNLKVFVFFVKIDCQFGFFDGGGFGSFFSFRSWLFIFGIAHLFVRLMAARRRFWVF